MSYDRESFIQSFVSFLPKNINELESHWNQMREDMDQAVQALIQNQKGTQPAYIDLGKGKCGSTIVVSTGCGKEIKTKKELLRSNRFTWSNLSKEKKYGV